MPPKEPRISAEDIEVVRAWIEAGSRRPASADSAPPFRPTPLKVEDPDRQYWAFRPLQRPQLAGLEPDDWSRNAVDKFILARLRAAGLRPNSPASSRKLIRRLSYGLRGLPPTRDELATSTPESLTERYLADSAYGERWARHWLDVARFGESTGYEADQDRKYAYKYRDAVIKALNRDLPFSDFVRWQIAGDEFEPDNPEAIALTGFLAAGPSITNEGGDRVKYDKLDDIVSTTGSAFLGLTVGCARCHDHKYDAISLREYYRMVGVFISCREVDVPLTPAAREERRKLEGHVREANKVFSTWRNTMRDKIRRDRVRDLSVSDGDKALLLARRDRKNKQQEALFAKYDKGLRISDRDMVKVLSDGQRAEMDLLKSDQDRLNRTLRTTDQFLGRVMVEGGQRAADNYVLRRGDFRHKDEKIGFGFLDALMFGPGGSQRWFEAPPKDARTPWRRRALANWITDPNGGAGALLARVLVNRLWHHHFGRGIVRTSGNFGLTGDAPSHPDLLEWLACELVENDWSLKHVHRLIVGSAAYRQSVDSNPASVARDPGNRLWWRRRPVRVEAEVWRDSVLAVSGTLNRQMFGPSIKPWIPLDAIATGSTRKWPTNVKDGPATWRRSVYIYTKRSMLVPMLEALDMPDSTTSCSVRSQTTTPPAALLMMNNAFIRIQAGHLAKRARDAASGDKGRIVWLYELALGRAPDSGELARGQEFLRSQSGASDPDVQSKAGGDPGDSSLPALINYCQAILSLNEFLYVD